MQCHTTFIGVHVCVCVWIAKRPPEAAAASANARFALWAHTHARAYNVACVCAHMGAFSNQIANNLSCVVRFCTQRNYS